MGAGIAVLLRFVQAGRNHNMVVPALVAAEMFKKEQEHAINIVQEMVLIARALLVAGVIAVGTLFQIAVARKDVIRHIIIVIGILAVRVVVALGLVGAM